MKKTEEEIRQEVELQFSTLMERADECSPGLREALRVYGNLEAANAGATSYLDILAPQPPHFFVSDHS